MPQCQQTNSFIRVSDLFHVPIYVFPYLLSPAETIIHCRGISMIGIPWEQGWLKVKHILEGIEISGSRAKGSLGIFCPWKDMGPVVLDISPVCSLKSLD